jgi:hypothetical protein
MRTSLLLPALICTTLVASPSDKAIRGAALSWQPTFRLSESLGSLNLTPFAGLKIAVKPLVDQRKTKDLLGENLEKGDPIPVTTKDDVSAFITAHATELMREAGLPLSDKAEGASVVLSGEVLRFHVAERNTYDADCQLLLQLEANGKVIWKGSILGHATRWGRSLKLENYCEALSNSLTDAISNLLKDPAFLKALADHGSTTK